MNLKKFNVCVCTFLCFILPLQLAALCALLYAYFNDPNPSLPA